MKHGIRHQDGMEAWLGVDAPAMRGEGPPWAAYGWAILSVVTATAIDQSLFNRTAEANLIMIYLLGILPVALRGDRGAAILAAVLSVAAFDFFFVHPFLTFAVSDTQYLLTFVAMGLVGGTISTLTARLAAELSAARLRERRAQSLLALSRSLLSTRAPAEVLAEGARLLGLELGLPVGAWLKGPSGDPLQVPPSEVTLTRNETEVLRLVLKEGMSAGPGTDTFPGAAFQFLPVQSDRQIHGVLVIPRPEGSPPLGPGERATLETSVNLLVIALDQARAKEEADTALRQADAERLRSALLSSVSHDLRTPLTGIVGSAATLVEGADILDPETRKELAQSIVEEANRLSRLVKNLLQATRLEAGSVQLSRTWFPLDEALSPALNRLHATLKPHPVTVALPPDLPFVDGDPVLIEQVFENLLLNAAKYTPPGTPIRLEARQEGDRLEVTVCDRGPGLPPGEEERVFEKFHHHPGRRGASGAGLGLAICRGIVTAHGGTMMAYNQTEGGACFKFDLPVAPSHGGNLPPHEV